jgi:hypothetical protein
LPVERCSFVFRMCDRTDFGVKSVLSRGCKGSRVLAYGWAGFCGCSAVSVLVYYPETIGI